MGATWERSPALGTMDKYLYQVGNNLLQENGWFICLCYRNVWVKDWIYTSFNNLIWPVLNPSIWLSWIRQHWEPNYIARAIMIIKNTVSLSLLQWQHLKILVADVKIPWPSLWTNSTTYTWYSSLTATEEELAWFSWTIGAQGYVGCSSCSATVGWSW